MKGLEAIMSGKSATFAVALAILAASGCASFPRDPALDDARLSLDAARREADQAVRLAAAARVAYDYRGRDNEPLYEAPVISARAVVGPPQQQCWVERQIVETGSPGINVPGAVVGGVIGGILGHQIGSGPRQDPA